MAGTPIGARKTSETIRSRYGQDYFAKIGQIGGSKPRKTPRPFVTHKGLAQRAGAAGGRVSRRGKVLLFVDNGFAHYRNVKTGEIEKLAI